MNKKIVLLVICLFILTGCNADYTLDIKKNLKINESLKVSETNIFYRTYYKNKKIDAFKSVFSGYNEDLLKKNKYTYELVEDKNNPYVKISKNYDDLASFNNNTIFLDQVFEKCEINQNDNILNLKCSGYYGSDKDNQEAVHLDSGSINIRTYYDVVSSNADNSKSNLYTWNIVDLDEDFTIDFTIDTSLRFAQDRYYLLKVLGGIIVIIAAWVYSISELKKEKQEKIKKGIETRNNKKGSDIE